MTSWSTPGGVSARVVLRPTPEPKVARDTGTWDAITAQPARVIAPPIGTSFHRPGARSAASPRRMTTRATSGPGSPAGATRIPGPTIVGSKVATGMGDAAPEAPGPTGEGIVTRPVPERTRTPTAAAVARSGAMRPSRSRRRTAGCSSGTRPTRSRSPYGAGPGSRPWSRSRSPRSRPRSSSCPVIGRPPSSPPAGGPARRATATSPCPPGCPAPPRPRERSGPPRTAAR